MIENMPRSVKHQIEFGMIMTEAAYRGGAEWLNQLMLYLENKKNFYNCFEIT